ncbi:MAG TPA: HTTM domain-containing protein [Candidatus Angelobacter sp.]|nr:HTTM domain-containing protein [Candidatus Angelobacter sp.]
MKEKRRRQKTGRAPGLQRATQGAGRIAVGAGAGAVSSRPPSYWMRFNSLLARPVNGASLAAFRIAVGVVMTLEAISLCFPSASTFGKTPLEVFYTGPNVKFTFPYEGFQWLPMLPAQWIHVIVALQVVAGMAMAAGLWYRASAVMVFLAWAYLYVVESTRTYWMSHHYLELLTTFLMIWMPAARRYSMDARLAKGPIPPKTVPYWALLLLRGQLVVSYFYAGVAKVNADWLLDGEPVRYFLSKARAISDYGSSLSPAHLEFLKRVLRSNECVYFISYAGAVFDLSVGFLLLFRRTRIFGFVLMLIFHATNHFIIFDDIGFFPLLGATTALIFLDADWPERFWRWLRRPRLAKPDWPWFAVGGILFPLVGVSLGWKLRPSVQPAEANESFRLARRVAPLVVVWLVWQGLMPLRHYLIRGDGRFTWEGLGFSWRLKAEVYRSGPCELSVEDNSVISRDAGGRWRIDWNEWHGDRVIYRTVTPDGIDWSRLPEIVALSEVTIGQRLIYNPFAASSPRRAGTEEESMEEVRRIWRELFGRQPDAIYRAVSPSQILGAYSKALRSRGYDLPTGGDVLAAIKEFYGRDGQAQMISVFRRMNPFGMETGATSAAPFLVIEDARLFKKTSGQLWQINPAAWVNGTYTRGEKDRSYVNVGGEPLVLYTRSVGLEAKTILPRASILDSQDRPDRSPYISWNYLTELTTSQGMHISMQPFLLRRYARHVAELWKAEYGRWPAVHALTVVSLNGRPFQELVDPSADLAAVSKSWFGHNQWIRNLQTPRIPGGAISTVNHETKPVR